MRLGYPFGNGKTSFRAAYGIYDTLPLTNYFSLDTVTVAPFGSTADLAPAPAYSFGSYSNYIPHCTGAVCSSQAYDLAIANPTNKVNYVQRNFSRPYVQQFLLNVEQQLAKGVSLELGYTGAHGVRQPLKSNDGNIVEPTGPGSTIQNLIWPALVPKTVAGKTTYATSGTKLNPAVGVEDTTLFNESTTYNALNLAVRGTGQNYRIGASYTWSKSLDESSSSTAGTNFVNSIIAPFPFYPARFKGPSDFNVTQNFVFNGLYTLTGVTNHGGFIRSITDGYQLGGIFRVATGLPFTPLISGDPLGLSSGNTLLSPRPTLWPRVRRQPHGPEPARPYHAISQFSETPMLRLPYAHPGT